MKYKKVDIDDELIAEGNKELIGKRAKIKDNAKSYTGQARGKTGVIIISEHTPLLYLKFDEPISYGYKNSCITKALVLTEGEYELI